jgi:hypothetical protein
MIDQEWSEIELSMSNFDGLIDDGFADALKAGPVFGRHAAYNFNGRVYFKDGRFHEDVWRYGVHVETLTADTLEELMREANTKYGYE